MLLNFLIIGILNFLVLELVTLRTVNEMVEVLKKEVGKTHNTVEHEDTGK